MNVIPVEYEKIDSRKSYLTTDCKSLFDAVTRIETSGLHLIEKLTALETLSLKERSGGRGVQHPLD